MFSAFAAPELSLTSSNGTLLATRAKSGKLTQYYFQNTRGPEPVKCPAWGCGSPDWNVALDVRLLSFTMIRFGRIWVHSNLSMSIHQQFPVDRKTVRK